MRPATPLVTVTASWALSDGNTSAGSEDAAIIRTCSTNGAIQARPYSRYGIILLLLLHMSVRPESLKQTFYNLFENNQL